MGDERMTIRYLTERPALSSMRIGNGGRVPVWRENIVRWSRRLSEGWDLMTRRISILHDASMISSYGTDLAMLRNIWAVWRQCSSWIGRTVDMRRRRRLFGTFTRLWPSRMNSSPRNY